jgi:transcription elongation factor SPT6
MARFIQDPLLCYTQLCNQERDILSLKLHPMQQQIITLSGSRNSEDSTELLRRLEIEFINEVNNVGVE